MRKTALMCLCLAGHLAFTSSTVRTEAKIELAIEKRIPELRRWAADPTVVQTVKRANAQARSLPDIREIDKQWQSTGGVDDFMRSLMTNAGSEKLRSLRSTLPEIAEAFVTDRRGANAAMTHKTSDYWQGDEAKFTKAIAGSRSDYHVEPVSFDESIQAYAVQIALAVYDDGNAIGVMVVTLNLEMLEQEQ
jgi:hypothetical protein